MIADIGAGAGNYAAALADRGYRVMAVEPSAAMRAQAAPHDNVTWISGSAEAGLLFWRSIILPRLAMRRGS